MSEQEPNNNKSLIRFIAQTVEDMRDRMATKDDLARLENRMAAKDDLARLENRMAAKDDLARLENRMAAKDDLALLENRMATKDDLASLGNRMARLEDRLDTGVAAVRGDIERVAVRVESLDNSVSLRFTAVEAAVSRVRSVVYLLVKDQPDLVRLLGPEPTHS